MKRIVIVVCLVVVTLVACACGNMSIGLGNFDYEKVHVETYNNSGCYTIEKWYDYERGIEVKTKEVGSLFCSEGTYILVEDECPFCDVEE